MRRANGGGWAGELRKNPLTMPNRSDKVLPDVNVTVDLFTEGLWTARFRLPQLRQTALPGWLGVGFAVSAALFLTRSNGLRMKKTMRKLRRILASGFLLSALVWAAPSHAQWNPLNPVASVKQQADGVNLTMKTGTLRLQVCSDSIVRVTFAPGATIPNTPAVCGHEDGLARRAVEVGIDGQGHHTGYVADESDGDARGRHDCVCRCGGQKACLKITIGR